MARETARRHRRQERQGSEGRPQRQVTVKYDINRPDNEIAAEVKAILDNDVWVDDALVHVEVNGGQVVLTGTVGSVVEKTRARENAWTAGVKSVDDSGLRVEPWAAAGPEKRDREFVAKSDEEIGKAVKDALMLDPRVFSFNPEVTVKNGTVILSGAVDSLKAKRAAEQDAKNTTGVWRVRNHLKVRPENPPPDDELAANVKAALVRDPYVDRYNIGVSAVNGTAYLTGAVDSYFERSQAEEIASGVKGVVAVNNGIVVSYPSYTYYTWPYSWYYNAPYYYNRAPGWWSWPLATDAEIKADIEDEFFWSPFVDGEKIEVSVNNGVATLTGTVDTWSDFNAATGNAYQAGAHTVVNQLEVRQSESQQNR
jgi:osmotically-inducible protein OsmY